MVRRVKVKAIVASTIAEGFRNEIEKRTTVDEGLEKY